MAVTIAISGKGGSGKTTVAAMMTRTLLSRQGRSILAVDADPNSCLGLALGVKADTTIADIREKARQKQPTNDGVDKLRTIEYDMQQAITEAKGFDFLTMGRSEGPSCYCAINNLLRKFLDKLNSAYNFVVIDNEAGMEHLSRRTTNNVDLLCIVADATPVGEVTAARIFEIVKTLPISVKQIGVIWNRTENAKKLDGLEIFGSVPYDNEVFEASMRNASVFDIEPDNRAFSAVQKILDEKLKNF